jgi:hypothetical protein
MVRHTPLQLVKEAKQIARDHGLRVAECPTKDGIDYVVYRKLPNGLDIRVGKRSTPAGIRKYVADVAGYH